MNEFGGLSAQDKLHPTLVSQKANVLMGYFSGHPEATAKSKPIYEDPEMNQTIIGATAEAWQNTSYKSKATPEQLQQAAVASAETLFNIVGSVIVEELPDPQTRQVFADASAMFLNSHVAQRRDPEVPFPYGAKLRSALKNLGFSAENRGTEQHPDYLVGERTRR